MPCQLFLKPFQVGSFQLGKQGGTQRLFEASVQRATYLKLGNNSSNNSTSSNNGNSSRNNNGKKDGKYYVLFRIRAPRNPKTIDPKL